MPQATFEVTRSNEDRKRDQRMMKDMTEVANVLGGFLPGALPQFMEPGLALHITGTTRIGKDPKESVANPESRVHEFYNLWVGGNGCIPDATASNPTRTSVAIAIKGANALIKYLNVKLSSGSYVISNLAHNKSVGHASANFPTILPIVVSAESQKWNVEYLEKGLYFLTLNGFAATAENNLQAVISILHNKGKKWLIKQRAEGVNEYTIEEEGKGWTLNSANVNTPVSLETIVAGNSKQLWRFTPVIT